MTRESTFGLQVGASADLRAFDIMGYIVANSATLVEALDNAARYLPLWTDGAALEIIADGSTVNVVWEYRDPSIGECRQDCEMTLLTAAQIAWRLARVAPTGVEFRHAAPRDAAEHRGRFRAPVRFGRAANQLVFERGALRAAISTADHRLCAMLMEYPTSGLGQLQQRR
jgi:Arabinose-binding domain of AraC transcription regulator, N-term